LKKKISSIHNNLCAILYFQQEYTLFALTVIEFRPWQKSVSISQPTTIIRRQQIGFSMAVAFGIADDDNVAIVMKKNRTEKQKSRS